MVEENQTPLLVVEDSDEDFEVLQILMEDMNVTQPIYRCKTGDTALELLYETPAPTAQEAPIRPAVILLDLNLPGTDGREVLEQLKQDEDFQSIPIIIFTTSSDPKDIKFCYQKGANGYFIKPVNPEKLERNIQAFVSYWLEVNTFPEWDSEVNLIS
ncbi:MAG: response regulator [Cyanobacteria bacterium P01_F01_bin.150]